jgi:transposase
MDLNFIREIQSILSIKLDEFKLLESHIYEARMRESNVRVLIVNQLSGDDEDQSKKRNDLLLNLMNICKKDESYKNVFFIFKKFSKKNESHVHEILKLMFPYLEIYIFQKLFTTDNLPIIGLIYKSSPTDLDKTKISFFHGENFSYEDARKKLDISRGTLFKYLKRLKEETGKDFLDHKLSSDDLEKLKKMMRVELFKIFKSRNDIIPEDLPCVSEQVYREGFENKKWISEPEIRSLLNIKNKSIFSNYRYVPCAFYFLDSGNPVLIFDYAIFIDFKKKREEKKSKISLKEVL